MKNRRNFISNSKGVISIEFAILLPILFSIFLGMLEYSRYIYHTQKAVKVTGTIADMVSLFDTIDSSQTTTELEDSCVTDALMITDNRIQSMLAPAVIEALVLPLPENSVKVIISLINKDPGESPKIAWQYEYDVNPDITYTSFAGREGNNANIPVIDGTPGGMLDHDNIILVEAAVEYNSIISSALSTFAPGINSDLITSKSYYPYRKYSYDINELPEMGINYTWPSRLPPSMPSTTNPNNC